MARLQLSKSSLSKQTASLKTYKQFLPSLDLKRQELMAQRARAVQILAQTREEIQRQMQAIAEELPMLTNDKVDLRDLVTIKNIDLGQESIMGAHLPVLADVQVEIRSYSFLAKPHWVDRVAKRLKEMLILRLRVQVEERRVELLDAAVRIITQRVNLFDKVLIPRTQENIRRIKIHLSDAERVGVINAKLAKNKRLQQVRA